MASPAEPAKGPGTARVAGRFGLPGGQRRRFRRLAGDLSRPDRRFDPRTYARRDEPWTGTVVVTFYVNAGGGISGISVSAEAPRMRRWRGASSPLRAGRQLRGRCTRDRASPFNMTLIATSRGRRRAFAMEFRANVAPRHVSLCRTCQQSGHGAASRRGGLDLGAHHRRRFCSACGCRRRWIARAPAATSAFFGRSPRPRGKRRMPNCPTKPFIRSANECCSR